MIWPLYSLINFVDKYLIEKYAKQGNVGSLILFSSAVGIPASLIIWFFNRAVANVSFFEALILILNGIMYTLWLIPYLYALKEDETSVVSPLFQISSIFTVILGFIFLRESLNFVQTLGILSIMLGATGLTLEIKNIKSIKIKLASNSINPIKPSKTVKLGIAKLITIIRNDKPIGIIARSVENIFNLMSSTA